MTEASPACRPHYKCQGETELTIPSPGGGPHASRVRLALSAPRTADLLMQTLDAYQTRRAWTASRSRHTGNTLKSEEYTIIE